MIRHTVVFRLKHPPGSRAERDFFAAAQALTVIPGVEQFEIFRQVGTKSVFPFGIAMEFAGTATYAAYNAHPEHTRFVQQRWLKEVEEFLELDHTPYFSRL